MLLVLGAGMRQRKSTEWRDLVHQHTAVRVPNQIGTHMRIIPTPLPQGSRGLVLRPDVNFAGSYTVHAVLSDGAIAPHPYAQASMTRTEEHVDFTVAPVGSDGTTYYTRLAWNKHGAAWLLRFGSDRQTREGCVFFTERTDQVALRCAWINSLREYVVQAASTPPPFVQNQQMFAPAFARISQKDQDVHSTVIGEAVMADAGGVWPSELQLIALNAAMALWLKHGGVQ